MNEFAGNGKLHDARAESLLHHYAVMLFDDFSNDAKVKHIENRLRDLLRNYDDKIKWGKRSDGIVFQPQAAGGNYPRKIKSYSSVWAIVKSPLLHPTTHARPNNPQTMAA